MDTTNILIDKPSGQEAKERTFEAKTAVSGQGRFGKLTVDSASRQSLAARTWTFFFVSGQGLGLPWNLQREPGRFSLSEIDYHQELPNDYIIPSEYYEKYRLVFSHYNLDRKLVRIGMNENQKRSKTSKGIRNTTINRSIRKGDGYWNSIHLSREENSIPELKAIPSEVSQGQYSVH